MTLAPLSPVLRPTTLEAALAAVRARGMRASSARRLLLTALAATDRPIPAEAIARGFDGRVPPSDIASVYRNLDALEEVGIVRRLRAAHGAAVYVLARPDDAGYLACDGCGEVRRVDRASLAAVRAAVRAALGWEASFMEAPMAGLCPACAQEETRCEGSDGR
jgi:Fur family ferric uptake transcriptional regulator